MNKHTIAKYAGLALAFTLPVAAQDSAPKNKSKRIEIEANDNVHVNMANDVQFNLANDVGQNFKHAFAFNVDGPGESPLIVSNGSLDQESIEKLEEDLSIMSRILAKAVNRDDDGDGNPDKAMGIHLWTLGGGRNGPRNLYLEGQGAVFVLNVPTPLVGSKNKDGEEKKESSSSSSSWESARNELYGDKETKSGARFFRERLAQSFDPARVEALKKNVTDSLKNASHIRDLKPNETVTVVLQGGGGRGIQRIQKNGGNNVDVFAFAGPENRGGPRSVMTLRAKKSDIDAFSSGKIDADEFRKKVTVTTYQTNPKQ